MAHSTQDTMSLDAKPNSISIGSKHKARLQAIQAEFYAEVMRAEHQQGEQQGDQESRLRAMKVGYQERINDLYSQFQGQWLEHPEEGKGHVMPVFWQ